MKKVDLTCRELDKIDVSFYKPEGAFYVFPKANKPNFDSVRFAKQLLEQHKVSISPGQSFGEYPSVLQAGRLTAGATDPKRHKSDWKGD